ncbi:MULTISPECIES: HNH endonuclease [Bacillus]|uniref:HNH endonuclease n=1 Tax=Bacillus TaxID=1386 RepID=UPI0002DC2399|nr:MULTISPECIES: HNH endonuclease [Bacillus]
MAKEWAKRFYKSKAWRQCRDSYISKVHGLCERCKQPGKILHHKEYLTPNNIDDPYVSLNHDNLEYLCQDCHNKEHHEKYSPVRSDVMFDKEGNLVKVGEGV